MDMESYAYIQHLKGLVEDGSVSMEVIDDAVRRILRVKYALGLFDDPYLYCNEERENTRPYHPDHMEAVLDMAKKSIVLLKNEGELLPLSRSQQNIAVIGPLAEEKNSPLGSWRIGSDDNSAVSVLEGLEEFASGNMTYARGADLFTGDVSFVNEVNINETDKSGFEEAVNLARNSEVVIMVLGEHGFQSGEGRSRTELGLPGVQQELLETVYDVNKNIVLVLMNGRPLAIPWAAENIPSIVEAWQLGTQSGNAIAQVLYGEYNPSGKLPMTFPRSVGQTPIFYNHLNTGRPAEQPTVFWSHYTDESNDPLYPFGFGLSYTSFEYSSLQAKLQADKTIRVQVTVANTGATAGEEVVQLYIHDQAASIARPVKELKGFKKIMLESGASETVEFILTEKELGFWNNEGEYVVEPGEFEIMTGGNSAEVLKTTVELN